MPASGEAIMRRIGLGVLLVLFIEAGLIGLKTAQAESALEMASLCRPVAKSDAEVYMPLTFETGRCWGAFAAIGEAFDLFASDQWDGRRKREPYRRP